MKQITSIDEIKRIQLNVLLAIHRFCEDNHIKYSLADGSLIGAIRHQGFIPWDDDIDLCLLREDYNRFIQLFPEVYMDNISVISLERSPLWGRPYAKAYHNKTVEIEFSRNNRPKIGVGIDIFPLDEVPDDEKEWTRYNRKRRFINQLSQIKSLKWSSRRSIGKNLFATFSQVLLLPFSFRRLAILSNRYCQIYNGKGHQRLYENCLGMILKHPFSKVSFAETIDVTFEGHQLKAMKGFDDCLTSSYGDYMKLPPEDKRNSHHMSFVFEKNRIIH